MPQILFQLADGTATRVDCAAGQTLMQIATQSSIPGIEAVCGGFCSCATCHVYIDAEWMEQTGAVSDDENELLDGTAADRLPGSRLACQVNVTDALDGLGVRIPDRQA